MTDRLRALLKRIAGESVAWAKAGIVVANDITADGSSKGDLILAATPENGYALQWDDDGDGFIESSTNSQNVAIPTWSAQ